MFSLRKEEFITAFEKWCEQWKEFPLLISGKTTHRRIKTVIRSVKTHLKWLYTYEDYTELQIPNQCLRLIFKKAIRSKGRT